ncbi:MAG TPA: DUF1361 domain-containing protein [Candidatus Izemoplasmatales bacterium]|nr:DUF1361 domain-containing protein [Candidatus Izemoplasmatales bacterium]
MIAELGREGEAKAMLSRSDLWVRRLWIVSGIYILSCPFVWWITEDFLHAFLAWNIVLALVPLLISRLVTRGRIRNRWILAGLGFLWLVFLPNALYLMTDLLYLGERDFWWAGGPYETGTYLRNFVDWLALAHLYVGAVLGLLSGTYSLHLVRRSASMKWGKSWSFFGTVIVAVLVGIGIYIGRFHRYNSWDFLNPWPIIRDFFANWDGFAAGFVGLMAGIQLGALFLLEPLFSGKEGS